MVGFTQHSFDVLSVQERMRVCSILDNFRQKINLFGFCDPSHTRPFETQPSLKLEYVCYCFFCPVLISVSLREYCPFHCATPEKLTHAFRGRDNSSFSDSDQCGPIRAAHVLELRTEYFVSRVRNEENSMTNLC